MQHLLVTGASGLLGRRVARQALAAGWQVTGTTYRSDHRIEGVTMRRLDLRAGAEQLIAELRPDAVVHTAYSRESSEIWPVTARGAAAVARGCAQAGARLIHLSSDALFAGREAP